jgi:hypothetical protein
LGFGLTWKVVAASLAGTSHAVTNTPCQDSCLAQVDLTANGLPILSIFVADGAGSASNGGDGAEIAVEASAQFLADKIKSKEFSLNDELAVELLSHVREQLYAVAEEQGLLARDFACTYLAVLATSFGTLVMQIGDGGIVIDVGAGLEVPIVPMSGEYANMTHFVTDEDAISVLVTKCYPYKAEKVSVFSDGIQRLALNMADNTAFEPFFAPFFRVLASSKLEQEDQLHGALLAFLNSTPVNERTDDDKTLALAVLAE